LLLLLLLLLLLFKCRLTIIARLSCYVLLVVLIAYSTKPTCGYVGPKRGKKPYMVVP
jgi:hypothetical protein